MNKQSIKGFVAGILVMLLLSSVLVFANAVNLREMREIHYGIGLVVNGETMEFSAESRPFTMEGRTFLPLRDLADILGVSIGYDPTTHSAYIETDIGTITPQPINGRALVGLWRRDENEGWRRQYEFLANNTGSMEVYNIYPDIEGHDILPFVWRIERNGQIVVTVTESGYVDEDEFDILFGAYRSLFNDREIIIAYFIGEFADVDETEVFERVR